MKEKEVGTDFVLLSQWIHMIRQFIEIYLYGPIKILQLHTPGRIQNF